MHLSQVSVHFYDPRGYATAPARPPIIVLDDESLTPPPLAKWWGRPGDNESRVPQERDLSEMAIWLAHGRQLGFRLASESNWV